MTTVKVKIPPFSTFIANQHDICNGRHVIQNHNTIGIKIELKSQFSWRIQNWRYVCCQMWYLRTNYTTNESLTVINNWLIGVKIRYENESEVKPFSCFKHFNDVWFIV